MNVTNKGKALGVTVLAALVVGGVSWNQLQLQKEINGLSRPAPVAGVVEVAMPTASPSATLAPTGLAAPTGLVKKVLLVPVATKGAVLGK